MMASNVEISSGMFFDSTMIVSLFALRFLILGADEVCTILDKVVFTVISFSSIQVRCPRPGGQ